MADHMDFGTQIYQIYCFLIKENTNETPGVDCLDRFFFAYLIKIGRLYSASFFPHGEHVGNT